MTKSPPKEGEDAAWVTIDTPFDAADLRLFLDDVERLYRINSLLVFDEWRQTGDNRFKVRAQNLSNDGRLDADLDVETSDDAVTVKYSDGLRTATTFRVDSQPGGTAKLVVTDDYSGVSLAKREARIDEVDKGLVEWGNSLHRYLHRWKRWSWVPGWKSYMRRFWQPMKPMARRIVFLLIVITVVEFIVFLFVFTIFWLERSRDLG